MVRRNIAAGKDHVIFRAAHTLIETQYSQFQNLWNVVEEANSFATESLPLYASPMTFHRFWNRLPRSKFLGQLLSNFGLSVQPVEVPVSLFRSLVFTC